MRAFAIRWCLAQLAAIGLATPTTAQVSVMLFTGNHPFVSRDLMNERPGGAITQMSEYDFSLTMPTPGGSVARSLMPATAMQCYLGDGDFDGNFLKFLGWKTSYNQPLGLGGVFVRHADRHAVTWDKVFFSVRFGPGVITQEFEVFIGSGIPYLIEPADWVRVQPNGCSEWFLAPGQLLVAVGPQASNTSIGCGALLQTANGDLYYSPSDGGHWLNGTPGPAVFAEDGSICKIAASDITYDPSGNVLGIAPNSARLLINETLGSGVPAVRMWVQQSGAMDRTGAPIQSSDYGKTGGLAFDPAGGTWIPAFPDAAGNFVPEPNLIFCTESPEYGGTLFATRNGGEVAVINGVLCGSTTPGQIADGAWLGVEFDLINDQPSLLGFTLIEAPPLPEPFIADQNDYGLLRDVAAQPTWHIDFHGQQNMPLFALIAAGPQGASAYPAALPSSLIPFTQSPDSWQDLFLTTTAFTVGTAVTSSSGYATVSLPNPNIGGLGGQVVLVQGVGLSNSGLQLSSPILVQLQ